MMARALRLAGQDEGPADEAVGDNSLLERDAGMVSVAVILMAFGALCAWVGVGPGAVLGYGGVVLWVSYVVAARRLDLFHVATGTPRSTALEETRGGR